MRFNAGRTATQNEQDLMLYCRLYREHRGHPHPPGTREHVREQRRHLKTLRARLAETGVSLVTFLKAYLSQDDDWLADRHYPVRYAVREENYLRLLDPLLADLAAPDEGPTVPKSYEQFSAERAHADALDRETKRIGTEDAAAHAAAIAARNARWLADPTLIPAPFRAKILAGLKASEVA